MNEPNYIGDYYSLFCRTRWADSIKTIKKLWAQFIRPEKRISNRYLISKYTQCFVTSPEHGDDIPVYLGDISTSGISFVMKQPWFDINQNTEITLMKDSENIRLKGQITSQRIMYPNGEQDLKHAFYRYSIKFENALSLEQIETYKDETSRSQKLAG